jgi:hypothetical protein
MTDVDKAPVTVLKLVFIGRDLDTAELEASLRGCLAP